jgi:small subunit ribosomal protein S1
MKDKSGIVSLPYGVEGICPAKHMKKEDGSTASLEEVLDFRVIEFNKDSKKIVVSHTRLFEEGEDKPASTSMSATSAEVAMGKTKAPKAAAKKATTSSTDQAVKAINQNSEKSTLGDLDALSALKEKMEKEE